MNDDYLFDPKAPPDPEIEKLERALRPFRFKDGGATSEMDAGPARRTSRPRRLFLVAAAAAALIVAAATIVALVRRDPPLEGTPVQGVESAALVTITQVEGDVRIDATARSTTLPSNSLASGDRIVCNEGGRAELRVGDIGRLTLEEKTRLRVGEGHGDEDKDGAYRLDLELGTVTAFIFAAPRVFSLGTPSGIAVDLGCFYRTTVDDEGHTTLAVTTGRVSFESDGRKVYVPAGASCRAWPNFGPGTPTWDKASEKVRAAAVRHDEARIAKDDAAALRAIDEILATEDKRDTLTIWHLLLDDDDQVRARVFDRLSALCGPPPVSRELCFSADPEALAAWREQLELECW